MELKDLKNKMASNKTKTQHVEDHICDVKDKYWPS